MVLFYLFPETLHFVQSFRKKNGRFRPAGGEISFRVNDRLTRMVDLMYVVDNKSGVSLGESSVVPAAAWCVFFFFTSIFHFVQNVREKE